MEIYGKQGNIYNIKLKNINIWKYVKIVCV